MSERVLEVLKRVIDPEMALDIVSLGLIYGIEDNEGAVQVRMTMTSAACPVAEYIVDEAMRELQEALGESTRVEVELVWDPPWGPERMTDSARAALAWDE